MTRIKRALLSVYDKTGIVPLARSLADMGVEILSTGGTAELLRKEGVPVKDVSSVTKFPEMLDGRVKTLHPYIHAGLLAVRDNEEHLAALADHNIKPIDFLAVNLYPFADALKAQGQERQIIEMIDIGGPAMLRSAAKNFKFVAAVSDPADYEPVLREMRDKGTLSEATRRALAAKVFRMSSEYDRLIQRYFEGKKEAGPGPFPAVLELCFEKKSDLRYGENPHQKGALYRDGGGTGLSAGQAGVVSARQLHGKELSFNNILDLDAALAMVEAFGDPACAIIKHTSPCGFATGRDAKAAFRSAYRCDSLSAFGSIVGFNTAVDAKTAEELLKSGFIECVIAEDFDAAALELLKKKKNLRLLAVKNGKRRSPDGGLDFKKVKGGLLVQERDTRTIVAGDLRCVTKAKPKKSALADLLFAFKVCRFVKSNAIVVAKNAKTVGLGMGQPSRVDSCRTALEKAGPRAGGAVLASDGFFPKPDSILLARKFGIGSIIQPGGSIQDGEVIKACDRAKISMVFTGVRHFKH
ncbi:MAG: bifunctional phosphoribosylaminoimidazolecarboxamide formyltransferase/IMP cyclohydrolase [Candidatus Omnitrophica bacterium]|nr:bifunctional phosphoribosylaminoimidazolecarboxamide formyltransferase/IMP cyclohydrolase [Candidatus Omnitrophota bacterium]